jgi:uncharacterized protein (DUF488 family)
MDNIFTIGFTKKTAQFFFELLKKNKVNVIVDIRLNNTSQLAGFSKFPDIKYFLEELCAIDYISDINFAPTDQILKDYKAKRISWHEYVIQFNELMQLRKINEYIKLEYGNCGYNNICLLCSEEKSTNCHRSLVAKYFCDVLGGNIINL